VNITIPENIQPIYTIEKNTIEIKITNTGKNRDTFYISVWPSTWVTLNKYFVTLNPNEDAIFSLTVEPPINAQTGNMMFSISARSADTGEGTSKNIILDIRRRTGIYISELKLNQEVIKSGESLVIQPVITNLDTISSRQILITTKILKDNLLIQKFEEEVLIEPADLFS
jgi:uncharacterized membrane protein